ncbi:MAG: hypothetical protein LC747_07225 [Acidobacteria bacterium]|nr:hypothetical protein [Acidobacteriota bacterium]
MSHHRKSILFVSALSILLAFPIAGRTDGLSKRPPPQRKGEMRKPVQSRHRATNDGMPVGVWGGEHISLQVTERGGAAVEFDCAHGTIAQRIILDRRGRFSVAGNYFEEHGGPVRASGEPDGYAVRFNGRVEGQTMKLTITHAETKELIGAFTLIHNQEPFLVKCR